jgi:hypothetical protein
LDLDRPHDTKHQQDRRARQGDHVGPQLAMD